MLTQLAKYREMLNNTYIQQIPSFDGVTLFNRTNGSIVKLSRLSYEVLDIDYPNVSEDKIASLLNDLERSEIFNLENIQLNNDYDTFSVTIEMSTLCNLKCTYCYQNGYEKRSEISNEALNSTVEYIERVFKEDSNIKKVNVGFIGGEPLLHKEKVVKVIKLIDRICEKYNKTRFVHLDTNGTIDFSEEYNTTKNMHLSITLSSVEDHNLHRPSSRFDSFETITKNLLKYNSGHNSISVRYNTNHENIHDFEGFVQFVKLNLPVVRWIEPMYTDNYETAEIQYRNLLEKRVFKIWNSTEAIEILTNYGYVISGGIQSMLQLCSAYQKYTCKVHADGYISLCDDMENSDKLNIHNLSKNISFLNEIFFEIKNYNPLNSAKCKECSKVVQCLGEVFCKKESCDSNSQYSENEFIQTYVKCIENGDGELFVNMNRG
jgi:uncharacterized protein